MEINNIKEQYPDMTCFEWYRADKGYYWDHDAVAGGIFKRTNEGLKMEVLPKSEDHNKKIDGPFLIVNPESMSYYRYLPLEEVPTLFLEFADLKQTENQILNFANKYGMLFNPGEVEVHTPRYIYPKGEKPHWLKHGFGQYKITEDKMSLGVFGDSFELWNKEITDMKNIVQIWAWWRNKDVDKLSLVITWPDEKTVCYTLGVEQEITLNKENKSSNVIYGVLATSETNRLIFSRFRFGDVFMPAQFLIQRYINEKLKQYPTVPRLLMDEKNRLKQYFMPQNLLSAMWFQFFQAVTGEKKFKKCAVCNHWEDVTNKKATWTKHPECAARERTARYRKRLKKKEG